MPVPAWQAARNGLPGDANAIDKSAQVNQLLGAHPSTEIYAGTRILTPNGTGGFFWFINYPSNDWDQPFTLSGTTVGRVTIPIMPVGNGADLQVSLCADNAGLPGTVIAQTRIPATWIKAFASTDGSLSGPLQVPQFNSLMYGAWSQIAWAGPALGASGPPQLCSTATGGNFQIIIGGVTGSPSTPVASVFTAQYAGGTTMSPAVPQPSLPQGVFQAAVAVTPDTIVVAGGTTGSGSTATSAVYTAGWNPNTGVVSAWSTQTSLPVAINGANAASSGETVYVVGGTTSAGGLPAASTGAVNSVYYATVQNGQITAWNAGTPLPAQLAAPLVAVVGNLLIVAGGVTAGGAFVNATYYANIASDGSIGTWQQGPPMPFGAYWFTPGLTANGIVTAGGNTVGAETNVLTLTATKTGLAASWGRQQPGGWSLTPSYGAAAFPASPGTWQVFSLASFSATATLYAVPRISVPLPASGLTNGAKYHVVMAQKGGDLNNYLTGAIDHAALPLDPQYRNTGTSTWIAYPGYQVPITVHDLSVGGPPWHTWEDNGARTSTLVYATTGDQRLLGIAEATQFADGTMFSDVVALTYPGTWPAGAWPPLGVTQLA